MTDGRPGGTDPTGSAPSDRRIERVRRFLLSVAGVITALTAVLAAIIGVYRLLAPAHSSSSAAPGVQTSSNSPAMSPGGSTLGNVPDSVTPAASRTTSASATPGERRRGALTLQRLFSADLDSTSPNWDVSDTETDYDDLGGFGCQCVGDGIQGVQGADIAKTDGPDAYPTCAAATAYGAKIDRDAAQVGAHFCVRTNQGRFAYLTVTDARLGDNGELGSLTVQVVVWEKTV